MFRLLLATYGYPPSIGGVEGHSQRLARALVRRGHRVTIVTAALPGLPEREIDATGVEIVRVSAGTGSRWRKMATYLAGMATAAIRRRNDIDVIHVQQALYPAATMTLIARAVGKPIVIRNSGSGEHGAVQLMRRLPLGATGLGLIGRLATTVSLSDEMTSEMRSAGFHRIIQIPNGVDVQATPPARAAARRQLGIDEATPVVLFVGRLDREKGTALLARAWPRVAERGALLLVAGDGPERGLLEQAAAAPHLRIDGFVSGVSPYYAAADVFVLPSESEGISNALLEAMAAGLPVVATAVGGNRAVIASPDLGVLVKPDDEVAVARELTRLLVDAATAARLGAAARAHVAAHWSLDAMHDAYERLYARLAADDAP